MWQVNPWRSNENSSEHAGAWSSGGWSSIPSRGPRVWYRISFDPLGKCCSLELRDCTKIIDESCPAGGKHVARPHSEEQLHVEPDGHRALRELTTGVLEGLIGQMVLRAESCGNGQSCGLEATARSHWWPEIGTLINRSAAESEAWINQWAAGSKAWTSRCWRAVSWRWPRGHQNDWVLPWRRAGYVVLMSVVRNWPCSLLATASSWLLGLSAHHRPVLWCRGDLGLWSEDASNLLRIF